MGKDNSNQLNLLFANIGSSDIGKEGKPLTYEEVKKEFELKGKEAVYSIELLLLEPVFKKLAKKGIRKLKAVFFLTKQTPPHEYDTYRFEPFLREVLDIRFKDKIFYDFDFISYEPFNWDAMFSHYSERMRHFYYSFSDVNFAFLSLTGGTPAQNFALLISALSFWDTKVKPYYVPKGKEEAVGFDVASYLFKEIVSREVSALENSGSFLEAAKLAEKYEVLSREKINLLKGLYYRSVFDFRRAKVYFEESGLDGSELCEQMKSLVEKPDEVARLRELLEGMKVKAKKGEFVDFLARLYRFGEEASRLIFKIITSLDISEYRSGKYVKFIEYVNKNPEIKEALVKKNRSTEAPNLNNLKIIFDLLARKYRLGPNFKLRLAEKGSKLCDVLIPFNEKRNNTIIAHGFEGCSKEDVEEIISKKINLKHEEIRTLKDLIEYLEKTLSVLSRS